MLMMSLFFCQDSNESLCPSGISDRSDNGPVQYLCGLSELSHTGHFQVLQAHPCSHWWNYHSE